MDRSLRSVVAVTQMTSTNDLDANWQQLEGLVCKAVEDGAQVVFLPECCDYIASNRKEALALAQDISGSFVTKLKDLAKREEVWLSVGGIHIKSTSADDHRLSNTHLLISSDGRVCGSYSKTHLFSNSIPGVTINEGDYVKPGGELVTPVPTPAGNVGLAICYDLRFPDLSQALRRLGAHILTFPSAFTVATGTAHWHTLLRARAIECQSYVVAAAQTGQHNDKRTSYGHALVVDPWGRVLCEVPECVGVAVAEVDMAGLLKVRREMPCLLHCRQDLAAITLQPAHHQTRLLHCEQLPAANLSQQFGHVTVPGDAIYLYSSLSYACSNLYPRVPGHSMVIPRRCEARFKDLSAGELSDLAQLTVLCAAVLCTRHAVHQCEVALQDGQHSGQTVKHVHVHLLPQENSNGNNSLLSPDVVSASQSPQAKRRKSKEKIDDMVADAAANRAVLTPALLLAADGHDASLHLPQPFQVLPLAPPGRRVSGTDVPAEVLCMRGANSFVYCVAGDWQKCHLVIQLVREVDTVRELRPSESHELFAAAHHLQNLLDKIQPDISTTFVIRGRSDEFESVQLHVVPWLEARQPSDRVYDYVGGCKRAYGDEERQLATLLRAAIYDGSDVEKLRAFLV